MLRLLEVQKAALTRHIRSQRAAPDITRGRRRAQKERKSKGLGLYLALTLFSTRAEELGKPPTPCMCNAQ
jgi:hypothetical protein